MTKLSNEDLEGLTFRQKINAIKDISANISALQSTYRSLNSFKPGVLDGSVDKDVNNTITKIGNNIIVLQEELEELTKLISN